MIHLYFTRKFNHLYVKEHEAFTIKGIWVLNDQVRGKRTLERETNEWREHFDWLNGKVRLDLNSFIQLESPF